MMHVLTGQSNYLQEGILVAKRYDSKLEIIKFLNPEQALVKTNAHLEKTIFIRHAFLVEHIFDETTLLQTYPNLLTQQLQKNTNFTIQVNGPCNTTQRLIATNLKNILIQTKFIYDTKNAPQIISLAFNDNKVYAGVGTPQQNLSSWPMGAIRFAKTNNSISRAEFKLLEALNTFNINTNHIKHALDLGAAPGGWSKILLQKGVNHVTAVDPAILHPTLPNQITHVKNTAENFLLFNKSKFDCIVNDMRLNGIESAQISVAAAANLTPNSPLILTIKLLTGPAYQQILEVKKILEHCYKILAIRQLFHNRQEVTLYAIKL